MPDAPLIATPQAYPLVCIDSEGDDYLVVGWTNSGTPVGVLQTKSRFKPKTTSGAVEITGDMAFRVGHMIVSVDGEVTVEGNGGEGVIPVRDVSS